MATLTIRREYADTEILFESDLDAIADDVETFLNVTRINDDNIQTAGITGSTKLVDASVSEAKIASSAISTTKIADAAVTAIKIASDAVTTAKILDANVTAAKLASDSVTTAKILDANVTSAKLASDSVTTTKILDSNVTTAKIADNAVTTAKIPNAELRHSKLVTSMYTGAMDAGTYSSLSVNIGTVNASGRRAMVFVEQGNWTTRTLYVRDTTNSTDILSIPPASYNRTFFISSAITSGDVNLQLLFDSSVVISTSIVVWVILV